MSKIIVPQGRVGSTGVIGVGPVPDLRVMDDIILRMFKEDPEPMSIRYIYYRFVTGELDMQIPKTKSEYDRISKRATNLRKKGKLNPKFIYDGSRKFNPTVWDEPTSPWHDAAVIPLLIVESESGVGIIRELAELYHVGLSTLKGQSSFTLKDLVADWINEQSKPVLILYCGDDDPSGYLIPNELQSFLDQDCPDKEPELLRLAITKEIVERFNLPVVEKDNAERTPTTELEALSKQDLRMLVQEALEEILPEGALEKSNQMLFAEDYREGLLRRWGLMIETALRNDESMPDKDDFLFEARYIP